MRKAIIVLVIVFTTFVSTVAAGAYLAIREAQKANQATHQYMPSSVRQWKA